ncbi:DASH complex subunit Dam1-domain-containing protein [Geopyxis carbonaria]|nr:DASH complex subunit Dam1-domain-containing protein [Geopyxis carbonaria]
MASSTTPNASSSGPQRRSNSRGPQSRPTTPLRRSSRGSLRASSQTRPDDVFPLSTLEHQFAELSDSMATLETNFSELQVMNDSLSRFNESFASFLYGLNMNAFCVDFPEAPDVASFKRNAEREERFGRTNISVYETFWRTSELIILQGGGGRGGYGSSGRDFDGETTFMTNDTSFVNEPTVETSTKETSPTPLKTPARRTPAPRGGGTRGGRGRGIPRGRGFSYR